MSSKKSLFLSLFLVLSMLSTVGCRMRDLGGKQQLAPEGIYFNIPVEIDLAGAPASLRPALAVKDATLSANVYKASDMKKPLLDADVDATDGEFTVEFYGEDATYYVVKVKRVGIDNDDLVLFAHLRTDRDVPTPALPVKVDERTTAEVMMLSELSIDGDISDDMFDTLEDTDVKAAVDNLVTKLATIKDDLEKATAVEKPEMPKLPEKIALDAATKKLVVDETFTLTATVTPVDAIGEVNWKSSDVTVATVDENGKVTALKGGIVDITAEILNKTATCKVTVVVSVTAVALDVTTKELAIGDSFTLKATVAPADATNKEVTWESSDETIATVANGLVTALAEGTTTVTVTTDDGSFTATCDVTVVTVSATSISIKAKTTIEIGKTEQLVVEFVPANTTNQEVTWESSDETIATVANGLVTAIKAGTATIKAVSVDGGFEAECEVTAPLRYTKTWESPETISGLALSQIVVKIGLEIDEITTLIEDENSKEWTMGANEGHTLYVKGVNTILTSMGLDFADAFTAIEDITSLTFSKEIPENILVEVYSNDDLENPIVVLTPVF